MPIAGGEVLTRRQSFQPWIEAGAFDIVQPDVTKVGGISEERRIAWMAQEHGIRFIPHGWNTAVGVAADLQLASAFADTDLVEYLTGSAYVDEIAAQPWQLDADGLLAIPDKPGLGLELNLRRRRPNTAADKACCPDPGAAHTESAGRASRAGPASHMIGGPRQSRTRPRPARGTRFLCRQRPLGAIPGPALTSGHT